MNKIVIGKLDELIDLVKKVKGVSERIEQVQDQDTERDHQLTDRISHLEVEFRSLREQLQQQPQRTQDKVAEVVQPIIDSTDSLTEAIEEHQEVPIIKTKKHWWNKKKKVN